MKLTEEQMDKLADFFEDECYGIEGNALMIDGYVYVDTILAAADYIRGIYIMDERLLYNAGDVDENLTYALDIMKADMQGGQQYSEFRTYWNLPTDYCITTKTLDELKRRGFRIIHRWCDKGTPDESDSYIVAWGTFEEWPYDEEY